MGGGNRFASNKEVLVWATFFFFFNLTSVRWLPVCNWRLFFFSLTLCAHICYILYTHFYPSAVKGAITMLV